MQITWKDTENALMNLKIYILLSFIYRCRYYKLNVFAFTSEYIFTIHPLVHFPIPLSSVQTHRFTVTILITLSCTHASYIFDDLPVGISDHAKMCGTPL